MKPACKNNILVLYSSHVEKDIGISRNTYSKAFNILVSSRFLVQDKGNNFTFYSWDNIFDCVFFTITKYNVVYKKRGNVKLYVYEEKEVKKQIGQFIIIGTISLILLLAICF